MNLLYNFSFFLGYITGLRQLGGSIENEKLFVLFFLNVPIGNKEMLIGLFVDYSLEGKMLDYRLTDLHTVKGTKKC